MSQEKLLELKVGKGLEAGIFPSAEPTAGLVWSSTTNAWFKDLSVEQSLGRQKILSVIGNPSRVFAQAFNSPNKSLYYETSGIIYQLNGIGTPTVFGAPVIVAALDANGSYWLEPWGTWLAMTDGINQPSLWQGAGTAINIGTGQFKTCRILKKLAQFLVAYSTDVAPNGFAWSDIDDPTNWTPASPPLFNSAARNLIIRDLDSEIVCVQDLAGAHAVYSRDHMILVQYVGPGGGWLGTPNQALSGIGAVSKRSVVAVGPYNFGLARSGIFMTDGTTSSWIDRPAIDQWIQTNVDFTQSEAIWGYWDNKLQLVVWIVPLQASSSYYSVANPRLRLFMDPKTRTVTPESIYLSRKVFGFLDGNVAGGMEQEVFEYPVSALKDGLYYESVPGTLAGSFSLTSQLFDAGDPMIYKLWDYAQIAGTFDAGAQISFGFTDQPRLDSIVYRSPQALSFLNPLVGGPQESIYFGFKITGTGVFRITGISVFGEKGGYVS